MRICTRGILGNLCCTEIWPAKEYTLGTKCLILNSNMTEEEHRVSFYLISVSSTIKLSMFHVQVQRLKSEILIQEKSGRKYENIISFIKEINTVI